MKAAAPPLLPEAVQPAPLPSSSLPLAPVQGLTRLKHPRSQGEPRISQRIYSGHLSKLPWRCAERGHDARAMESHSQRHLLILFLSIFKEGLMVVSLPPSPHLSQKLGICTLLRAWASVTLKTSLNEHEALAWGTCAMRDGI